MEPRQQWRGNEKGLEGRKMTTISFNGAAPTMARKPNNVLYRLAFAGSLQWSRANNGAETGMPEKCPLLGEVASMEPRQQWRGNKTYAGYVSPVAMLQWSRANNGAETGLSCTVNSPRSFASMEPRQQWRGNAGAARSGVSGDIASMEPRQQWRGNPQLRNTHRLGIWLQWSRANNGAETPAGKPGENGKLSFNGAAPTMARKRKTIPLLYASLCRLQWSRANNGAETRGSAGGEGVE